MGELNKTNTYTEFYYHFFRNTLIVSLPIIVISALILGLTVSHSSATSSGTDSFTVSISSACTLSSVVDSEHNIETNVGTYVADVGKTTIKTLCNDGNGYNVYANGYSNNEEGNNKLINSERPEYSIDTGLNTSGLTSQWAMKLNNIPDDPSPTPPTIESDYNNTYGIVPPYWTKVVGRASGTTDMAEGSSFTTTYAVYASSSQYAGTYQGQVKYLLTHPAYPPAFRYMQDVDKWKNELTLEESVQAIDTRDGKKYWVTKLQDGNVWMTQNLDFDIVSDEQDPTKTKTLTSEDTDLTDHSLTGAYSQANGYNYDSTTGITSWTPVSTAKTINFEGTTVTGWQNSSTAPYSASKTDDTNTGHASLGNYYNWSAAVASNNSSTLASDTINDISQNPQNSICPKGWRLPTISNESGSIINSTNEFGRLNYLYNDGSTNDDANLLSSPLWFIRTGYISNSVIEVFYTRGYYWSSTAGLHNGIELSAYMLGIGDNFVNIATIGYNGRFYGFPVRCVAR